MFLQQSNFRFAVRVHGRAVEVYRPNQKSWIEARRGTHFTLYFKNDSLSQVLVVPTVDGLSVLDGKIASFSSPGYIVAARSELEIDGWRESLDKTRAFEFVESESSYASKRGKKGNIGVIGLAVFESKITWHFSQTQQLFDGPQKKDFFPYDQVLKFSGNTQVFFSANNNNFEGENFNAFQSSLGTGWGEEQNSPSRLEEFERAEKPVEVFQIFYASYDELVSMGIIKDKTPRISAFPEEKLRFCPPPSDK